MKDTKLDKACKTAIKVCMGAKKDEKILIISDEKKKEIGYSLYKNALALGYFAVYSEMKSAEINGQEPPNEIANLMKMFDIVLCPTEKSLTHTNARRAASKIGVRVATFPGITKEIMIRGMNADYKKISRLSIKLKKVLDAANFVRITSPKGTDLTFSIAGRKSIASKGLYHKKGESGNLPTGETFIAPIEGTANGIVAVDGSMAGFGLIKKSVLKIEVKEGIAVKISGGNIAGKLNQLLNKVGKEARNIAEFGIGTNGSAKLSGVVLEDEKILGTIHIALGNNISMGGKVNVPLHMDGVILNPAVVIDGKILLYNGKLKL